MTEISRISFSTICYVTEDITKVSNALKNCFPEDLRENKIKTQKIQSQFGDKLIILDIEFNGKDANSTVSYLGQHLDANDKNFIGNNLPNKIDFEQRLLHLRLDKFLPLNHQISLAEGSDVIKVEIKYQVFTSQQNNLENIRNSLIDVGLLEE